MADENLDASAWSTSSGRRMGKKVGGSKQKLEEEEERQPVALPRKHPNAHCTIMNSSLLLYTAVLTSISFPWCGIML
jgi:hypothetical protein